MSLPVIFLYIAVMALVTYLIRALPLILVKKQLLSRFFTLFLNYIPFAVLSAMTFPAILYACGDLTAGLLGTVAAILLAFWSKNLLISAVGASAVAYLVILFL